MEQYCRRDPKVALQIESIISDPSKGVEFLLSHHLTVPFVSRLVSDVLTRRAHDVGWLRHCLTMSRDADRLAPTVKGFDDFDAYSPPLGQIDEHMQAYHHEVTNGRFNYASDGRMNCVTCLKKARQGFQYNQYGPNYMDNPYF